MYKKIEPNGSIASIVLQLVEVVNRLQVQMELGKVEGLKQELTNTESSVEKDKANIDYLAMMTETELEPDEANESEASDERA